MMTKQLKEVVLYSENDKNWVKLGFESFIEDPLVSLSLKKLSKSEWLLPGKNRLELIESVRHDDSSDWALCALITLLKQ